MGILKPAQSTSQPAELHRTKAAVTLPNTIYDGYLGVLRGRSILVCSGFAYLSRWELLITDVLRYLQEFDSFTPEFWSRI